VKRLAALATTYFPASHADVILSRWMAPIPGDATWGWERPRTRIASLYVAQPRAVDARALPGGRPAPVGRRDRREEVDLAPYYAEASGVPLCPTIREALTLGGQTLAVDGVLLIGEHGDYPYNEFGQKLYPRKEVFDEVVAVFRDSGRGVPVFVDKHLSWNPDWADEMVATAREMDFPLMAGSNLPLAGFAAPVGGLEGAEVTGYVGLFYAGAEVYGFHSLEWMQSLIEHRAGGETGIAALTALKGDAVWEALEADPGTWELFAAALDAAPLAAPGDVRANLRPDPARPSDPVPTAFVLEFADGLRATHVSLHGHLNSFASALRTRRGGVLTAAPRQGVKEDHYGHFAALNARVEEMFLTGRPPIPIERTLLTTKTIAACMHALKTPGRRVATPHLLGGYRA